MLHVSAKEKVECGNMRKREREIETIILHLHITNCKVRHCLLDIFLFYKPCFLLDICRVIVFIFFGIRAIQGKSKNL